MAIRIGDKNYHSVANMHFIPLARLVDHSSISFSALFSNLIPVTLGNIVGGGGLVAFVYWLVYSADPGYKSSIS
ncbi:MAG: formate transporter [Gammaproteobacteria bacterium]|jgi:formate transporter